ncbi:MAG: class I adenylate-forming enzyme family protein [Pseudomonadota bacterium]
MNTLPLLPDSTAAVLAYRNARPVSPGEFLGEVLALAARLPSSGQVLNLCKDRYWFAVTLFAAISRGVLSLLPNSSAPEHIAALCAAAQDLICLGDQAYPPFHHTPYMRVSDADPSTSGVTALMPRIPYDQRIAWVFTSGSTGEPQAHSKTFGRMLQSVAVEAERLWSAAGGACAVLGTVPFQHMYGLESTVLLPILGGGQLSSRLPFFPTEVITALAELPAPRLLVTTPFYLRKLLDAGIAIPPVATVLCATAPLSQELAGQAEAQLGAPIMEIYGSTETGQLATRRPTVQTEWETFTDITLSQDQGATTAAGDTWSARRCSTMPWS